MHIAKWTFQIRKKYAMKYSMRMKFCHTDRYNRNIAISDCHKLPYPIKTSCHIRLSIVNLSDCHSLVQQKYI